MLFDLMVRSNWKYGYVQTRKQTDERRERLISITFVIICFDKSIKISLLGLRADGTSSDVLFCAINSPKLKGIQIKFRYILTFQKLAFTNIRYVFLIQGLKPLLKLLD